MPWFVRLILIIVAVVIFLLLGFDVFGADSTDPTQLGWLAFGLASFAAAMAPVYDDRGPRA